MVKTSLQSAALTCDPRTVLIPNQNERKSLPVLKYEIHVQQKAINISWSRISAGALSEAVISGLFRGQRNINQRELLDSGFFMKHGIRMQQLSGCLTTPAWIGVAKGWVKGRGFISRRSFGFLLPNRRRWVSFLLDIRTRAFRSCLTRGVGELCSEGAFWLSIIIYRAAFQGVQNYPIHTIRTRWVSTNGR